MTFWIDQYSSEVLDEGELVHDDDKKVVMVLVMVKKTDRKKIKKIFCVDPQLFNKIKVRSLESTCRSDIESTL